MTMILDNMACSVYCRNQGNSMYAVCTLMSSIRYIINIPIRRLDWVWTQYLTNNFQSNDPLWMGYLYHATLAIVPKSYKKRNLFVYFAGNLSPGNMKSRTKRYIANPAVTQRSYSKQGYRKVASNAKLSY